ncbi:hypothetical protein D1007_37820 [Hordeum vulgare]|nr:hypothetical protein D1007_37820 [Hordeum vulgare]
MGPLGNLCRKPAQPNTTVTQPTADTQVQKPSPSPPPPGMAEQLQPPFNNADPATAADPRERERCAELMLAYIYSNLPNCPLYDGTRFTALAASRGADRLSRLPHDVLRNVIARLPVKDAARTAVLSSRWRALWRSTPLVLADIHLLPKAQALRPKPSNSPAVTAAVSRILEAHPGPFACVHLICSQMDGYRARLARWLQLLAAKGAQDLVLVNRPWPLDVPLPATLFTVTTLTRLHVGVWKLPGTAALRGASFPRLRELGLYFVEMEQGLVDSLVARSPVLEVLNIVGCINGGLRLRLVSQSLRCVQICGSVLEDIAVVKAPRLERLILIESCKIARGLCTRLRIVDAPKLHIFGYLEPGQVLEVGETVIMVVHLQSLHWFSYQILSTDDSLNCVMFLLEFVKFQPGIKASASAMLTSVKILTLNVRFGVRNDVKMVPTFLKCFPNAERLHIVSEKGDYEAGSARLNLNFWKLVKPTENIKSCIKVFSYKEFRGELGEVAFLKFFFRNARVLSTASVSMANPSFTSFSMDEATHKAQEASKKMASSYCEVVLLGSTGPEGGKPWSFKTGTDYSFEDPFSVVHIRHNA